MRNISIAACIGLLGSAAFAQSPVVIEKSVAPFRVVSYSDLNLASETGRERLQSRIRGAAREICLENTIENLESTMGRRHCYKTAVADGLRQMKALERAGPALAAAALTIRGE